MDYIDALMKLLKWARSKWYRMLLAAIAVSVASAILLMALFLNTFVETKDRWVTLLTWISKVAELLGLGVGWVEMYWAVILSVFIVLLMSSALVTYTLMKAAQWAKSLVEAKREISDLLSLIDAMDNFPYTDGRTFERQLTYTVRAAVAKNGVIGPKDYSKLVARLNERDVTFGAKLEEILKGLKENNLI